MTSSTGTSGDPRIVPLADLRFDRRSPRLSEVPPASSEDDILERLWRESALEGLAASIALHGFLASEPLIVEQSAAGLVVVDGNRRLAAVRLLAEPGLRDRLGVAEVPALPAAETARLQWLPALVSRRDAAWQSVGYRHVGGAQPWRSYARAGYVAWVHEELGVPLERVAQSLGDGESSVRTLYRAWRALRAAEAAGAFLRDDRWTSHLPFSLLVAALDRPGIQEFVGLADRASEGRPVPAERLAELGDLCVWLFGRRSRDQAPIVRSHEPDLRMLEHVVRSASALAALRQGQSLSAAYAISRDSRRRFQESVLAARHLLQEAQGAMPVRTPEQSELLRVVDDLVVLVQRIRDEIEGTDPPRLLTNS
jgi:ParB-like nuclease domain